MHANILVATDLGLHSLAALRYAVEEFNQNPATRITVLNVAPFDEIPALYPALGSEGVERMVTDGVTHNHDRLTEFMTNAGFADNSKISWKVVRCHGTIAQSICEYARSIRADHIVMVIRSHSLIREALVGSIPHDVLSHAPCPVTLVGPEANAALTHTQPQASS